jgi:hypothetical protein
MRYFAGRTSKDPATVAADAIAALDREWADPRRRLLAVPGKRLLAALNGQLQRTLRVSITPPQIMRNMPIDEIESGLREILRDMNEFACGQRPARHFGS